MPTALTEGFCRAEVKPAGPVQAKVAPVVVEVPVIAADWVVQLRAVPVEPTFGAVVLPVTTTEAVLVQPFDPPVTVTIYVPAVPTAGLATAGTVTGPLQA